MQTPHAFTQLLERLGHAYGALDYVLHPEGHILLWERAQAFFAQHL